MTGEDAAVVQSSFGAAGLLLESTRQLAGTRIKQRVLRIAARTSDLPPPDWATSDGLTVRTTGIPDWWMANGNLLITAPDAPLPVLQAHPGLPHPSGAIVVIAQQFVGSSTVTLWGHGAMVLVGPGCTLHGASFNCGGGSTLLLGGGVSCMNAPVLNARNGGAVVVDGDGLWSSGVTLFTDDMHAILDAETGRRLNAYGGLVRVRSHVWLGIGALLLPGADVGAHSVVGARAMVNAPLPANAICVGAPARAVRTGVTWSFDDVPPDDPSV